MVSKSAASELFKAAAASCGVSGKELGQLLAFLARMPEERLTCFPTAGDNVAIVEFVRDGYRAQGKKFHEGRFGLVAAFRALRISLRSQHGLEGDEPRTSLCRFTVSRLA